MFRLLVLCWFLFVVLVVVFVCYFLGWSGLFFFCVLCFFLLVFVFVVVLFFGSVRGLCFIDGID